MPKNFVYVLIDRAKSDFSTLARPTPVSSIWLTTDRFRPCVTDFTLQEEPGDSHKKGRQRRPLLRENEAQRNFGIHAGRAASRLAQRRISKISFGF